VKYAILSDVHGNLEALTAVLDECKHQGVERILFLGDAVGYGADPGRCLQLLRETAQTMIMGNHDSACALDGDIGSFNEDATAAVLWTRDNLSQGDIDFLKSLPLEHFDGGMHLVHSSPHLPHRWHYIMTEHEARQAFAASNSHLIFVGHSHIPINYVEVERRRVFGGEVRKIEPDYSVELKVSGQRRYIINVGSVGQPRDHDPRAAYGLYDSNSRSFQLSRVSYDQQKTSEKILRNGLPGFLAARIKDGI